MQPSLCQLCRVTYTAHVSRSYHFSLRSLFRLWFPVGRLPLLSLLHFVRFDTHLATMSVTIAPVKPLNPVLASTLSRPLLQHARVARTPHPTRLFSLCRRTQRLPPRCARANGDLASTAYLSSLATRPILTKSSTSALLSCVSAISRGIARCPPPRDPR